MNVGDRFGRVVVSDADAGRDKRRNRLVCVTCDCGERKTVLAYSLTGGSVRSCGCLRRELSRELNKTHGKKRHPLYRVWEAMKRRCASKVYPGFHRYGGRGIEVCERWNSSFEAFYEDMSSGYKRGLSLDRIDNNGPYSPDNCRWATQKQQQRNRGNNIMVNVGGEQIPLIEECERLGLPYHTIRARIGQYGWSIDRALNTPVISKKQKSQLTAEMGVMWEDCDALGNRD